MDRFRCSNGRLATTMPFRSARLRLLAIVLLPIVIPVLAGCAAARHREVADPSFVPRPQHYPDSLFCSKAFGTLLLSYRGERNRAKIDVINRGTDFFECSVYGPFGGPVVTLSAGPESLTVAAANEVRRLARSDSLSTGIRLLREYPFTFNDLIRILTGRLYDHRMVEGSPDSVVEAGRERCFFWAIEEMRTGLAAQGRRIEEIRHSSCSEGWVLSYRKLREGIAAEIRFQLDPMNYFTATYDRITLGPAGSETRIK